MNKEKIKQKLIKLKKFIMCEDVQYRKERKEHRDSNAYPTVKILITISLHDLKISIKTSLSVIKDCIKECFSYARECYRDVKEYYKKWKEIRKKINKKFEEKFTS